MMYRLLQRSRLLAAASLMVCASVHAADPAFSSGERFDQRTGAGLFAAICAGCHQPHGEGAQGAGAYPALAGNPRVASAAYVATMVLYGRKAMPGFAQQLDDAQIAAVAGYVKQAWGAPGSTAFGASDVAALRH